MSFTIPPPNKVDGQSGFIADIDNAYAALALVTGINVLNSAYAGGADPTGVADSTAAIQAALNAVPAGGGVVRIPAGTYKVSGTLTVSVPKTFIQGDGQRNTTIQFWGAGSCIYMHADNYADFSAFLYEGGGIKGLSVDGTHAAGVADGLNFGDWFACEFDMQIIGFTAVGSNGLHMLNSMGYTEKTRGQFAISKCDTCVAFDVSTTVSTANRSFGYTDLVVEMDGMTGNGITLLNGAQVYHSRLVARANVSGGAGSAYACLSVQGKCASVVQNPGSPSQISASRLDFQAEANATTPIQSTILLDITSDCRISNCAGILDFAFGQQMALSNYTQTGMTNNFQFEGIINGDTRLNPASAGGAFATAAAKIYGKAQVNSTGQFFTAFGDFGALTLSANTTISLGSVNWPAAAGPQRKTFLITQPATGGPFTVTWPNAPSPSVTGPAVRWAGGTPPVMTAVAGASDLYQLETFDGATWYGTAIQHVS